MPRILRVNDPHGEPIGTAVSHEGIVRMLEGLPPGRYHINEIQAEPSLASHTSRASGSFIDGLMSAPRMRCIRRQRTDASACPRELDR